MSFASQDLCSFHSKWKARSGLRGWTPPWWRIRFLFASSQQVILMSLKWMNLVGLICSTNENITSFLVLLIFRCMCGDLVASEVSTVASRDVKEWSCSVIQHQTLQNVYAQWWCCYTSHIKAGRKHTVYPNEDIAKWDWNLANDAPV